MQISSDSRPLRTLALTAGAILIAGAAFTSRLPGGTPVLPAVLADYTPTLPAYLTSSPVPVQDNTPASNPTTDAGATLGRVLFYDTRLSANLAVSCASCHRQADGFSDPAPRSTGFLGGQTARHSMPLAFARYYPNGRFFWDERAATLEEQVLMPIQDGTEMGMTLDEAVARASDAGFYGPLFTRAFGSPEVTPERMGRALAQFVRAMVPTGSRYDEARSENPTRPSGEPLPGFTPQENQGLQLFFGRAQCHRCHGTDTFAGTQARNNGLDVAPADAGAGAGRFKVGSLRSVSLTAPYMHDGRFQTLADVVNFYDAQVQDSPTLDPILRGQNGRPLRLNLTSAERAALVAFMRTLTDDGFATDPRFSDPFTSTTVGDETPGATSLALSLVGPNPTRGQTALRLALPEASDVAVAVFDARGRRVATLAEGRRGAGETRLVWDAAGLPAGRYLVRATAGSQSATQSITVIR